MVVPEWWVQILGGWLGVGVHYVVVVREEGSVKRVKRVKRVKIPGGLHSLAVVELLGCGGEGWEGWWREMMKIPVLWSVSS